MRHFVTGFDLVQRKPHAFDVAGVERLFPARALVTIQHEPAQADLCRSHILAADAMQTTFHQYNITPQQN